MVPEWFNKAKLGIFIHWGIYAVEGTKESWEFAYAVSSHEDYMRQCKGFTALKYEPKKWAELFKKSGAKYAVMTAKHADGVALWDSKYGNLNVVHNTPAARDLVTPYCDALRDAGIKVGLYFCHVDWSHDEHMAVICDKPVEEIRRLRKEKAMYVEMWREVLQRAKDDVRLTDEHIAAWKNYMDFYFGQLDEVLHNFGPLDVLWFDSMFERAGYDWQKERIYKEVRAANPDTIISRLPKYSDIKTPEVRMPVRPVDKNVWEYCTPINQSWGFRHSDNNYKTPNNCIRIFCDTIAMGGNLLLDIGPKEDSTIDERQEKVLLELGEFIHKNEEAIYETTRGVDWCFYNGGSVASSDGKTLYLFVHDIPREGVEVKGIDTQVKKATILSTGKELEVQWFFHNAYGCFFIHTNPEDMDPKTTTVIKVEFVEKFKANDDWGMLWELKEQQK